LATRLVAVVGLLAAIGLVALGVWLFVNVPHDPGFWAFVGVIVGGFITATVTIAGQLVRAWSDTQFDRYKRTDDRRIESDRLQRDTLLELQERLTDWMLVQLQVFYFDVNATGKDGYLKPFPDSIRQPESDARKHLDYLIQRVLDENLREELRTLRRLGDANRHKRDHSRYPYRKWDKASIEKIWDDLNHAATDALAHLGEVLRHYL
jgi:hypothetical protein